MVNGGVTISKNTLRRKGMFIPVCLGFFSVLLVNLQRFTEQEKDKDEENRIKINLRIIIDFLRQSF